MDLKNVKLIDLQTSRMKQDPTTQGMCAAIEPQLKKLAEEINLCSIYARVDNLPEVVLDELAWQFHVDFYDVGADLAKKRALVKNSFIIHKIKGTPHAVDLLIESAFETGEVKEWFKYGGLPHRFRVVTNNQTVTGEQAAKFIMAVNTVKRKSQWLEAVELTQIENMNLYYAGILRASDHITIG